jgi:hypothetical protein
MVSSYAGDRDHIIAGREQTSISSCPSLTLILRDCEETAFLSEWPEWFGIQKHEIGMSFSNYESARALIAQLDG